MTASRNTVLAFGLMLLALAAGNSAEGASPSACGPCAADASCNSNAGCGAGCDACCNSGCAAGCNAACNNGCNAGCNAGCNGGCAAGCNGNCAAGCNGGCDSNSCQTPGCCGTRCIEEDPVFGAYAPYFSDLLEVCEGCSVKAEAGLLLLHRSVPGNATVLLNPTIPGVQTGPDRFDSSQLEYTYETGPRISLTVLDCAGWGVELNYFGVNGWSTETTLPTTALVGGMGNLVVDRFTTPIPLADAHFESIARLYSTEANFRAPLCGSFTRPGRLSLD